MLSHAWARFQGVIWGYGISFLVSLLTVFVGLAVVVHARQGKKLHLVGLSPECTKPLNIDSDMVDVRIYEDLQHWHIATDELA
jgi:hypothetical protein